MADAFYRRARLFHLYFELGVAVCSYTLNAAVAYLSLTTRNQTMRQFCAVLLMNVAADLLYATTNLVTMQIVEPWKGNMFLISTGLLEHVGARGALLSTCLFLVGLYLSMTNATMQFLYRYNMLCMDQLLTPAQWRAIYAGGVAYSTVHGFAAYFCLDPMSEEATAVLRTHPLYATDTPAYSVGRTVAVIVGYSVIVYTGKKINDKLHADRGKMSAKTMRGQKSLTKVMVMQAACPALVVALPVMVDTIFTQFHIDYPLTGTLCVSAVQIMPVINPVTVIYFIPSFRKRVLCALCGLMKQRVKAEETSSDRGNTARVTERITSTISRSPVPQVAA